MKKSGTLIYIMLVCLLANMIFSAQIAYGEDGGAADNSEYEYFLNSSDENAYVLFGEKIRQNNCSFLDGASYERTNPLYNAGFQSGGETGSYPPDATHRYKQESVP